MKLSGRFHSLEKLLSDSIVLSSSPAIGTTMHNNAQRMQLPPRNFAGFESTHTHSRSPLETDTHTHTHTHTHTYIQSGTNNNTRAQMNRHTERERERAAMTPVQYTGTTLCGLGTPDRACVKVEKIRSGGKTFFGGVHSHPVSPGYQPSD